MMKKTFFHTLAASVMLAATAGLMVACSSNDDEHVVTPPEPEQEETNPAVNELLTDFVKTVSGIEKYPAWSDAGKELLFRHDKTLKRFPAELIGRLGTSEDFKGCHRLSLYAAHRISGCGCLCW